MHCPPFEGEVPFTDSDAFVDVHELVEWMHKIKPRTRMDTYPLFLLQRGMLRKLTSKEIELTSKKVRKMRLEVSDLKNSKEELHRRLRSQADTTLNPDLHFQS